jgi:hypothetical protein
LGLCIHRTIPYDNYIVKYLYYILIIWVKKLALTKM